MKTEQEILAHARAVINARPVGLMTELREAFLECLEASPELCKRIGHKPGKQSVPGRKVNGVRKPRTIETGRSLASLLKESGESRQDRERETEATEIERRVSLYAQQFENSAESAEFEVAWEPSVPGMIRKLKNDTSRLI